MFVCAVDTSTATIVLFCATLHPLNVTAHSKTPKNPFMWKRPSSLMPYAQPEVPHPDDATDPSSCLQR